MCTLSFKKEVYGPDGNILPDDQAAMVDTTFSFRLYLGNEFVDADNLPLADMYKYYIKDPDDYYVQWNAANKSFIPTTAKTFSEFLALDETCGDPLALPHLCTEQSPRFVPAILLRYRISSLVLSIKWRSATGKSFQGFYLA